MWPCLAPATWPELTIVTTQAEKEEREAQEAARKAELDAKEAKRREAALGPAAKKKGKK